MTPRRLAATTRWRWVSWGDAGAVARQLSGALREQFPEGRANPDWTGEVATLKSRRQARLEAEAEVAGEPMMPQRVYSELAKVLPRDCMVTIDAGIAPRYVL